MYEIIKQRRKLFSTLQKIVNYGLCAESAANKIKVWSRKDYSRLLRKYEPEPATFNTFNKRLLHHLNMMERLIWDAVKQDQRNSTDAVTNK